MAYREIRRFKARGASGTVYTVIEHQKFTTHRPATGPSQELPGPTDFRLDDGTEVSDDGGGVFRIVETDEIIREI